MHVDGRAGRKEIPPGDSPHPLVKIIEVRGRELGELQPQPVGRSQTDVAAGNIQRRALEGHAPVFRAGNLDPQVQELGADDGFETKEAAASRV